MSDGQREPSLRETITSAMDSDASPTTPAAPAAPASAAPAPASKPLPDAAGAGAAPPPTAGAAPPTLTDPKAPAAAATPDQAAISDKIPPAPPWIDDLREWQAAPDGLRQKIRAREAQFNKSWQQQSQAAKFGGQLYNELRPYEATLRATGINPVQLVREFAATHELLSRGTPQEKAQAVLRVCQRYGIDLGVGQQPEGGETPPHPRIAQLEQAIGQLTQFLHGREQQATQYEAKQVWGNVDQFAKDPQNEFFPHLWERMAHLIETGAVQDLKGAYKTALYERDDLRAILGDRDAARRHREAAAARSQSTAGGGSPVSGASPVQSDSLRATIEQAWDAAA